MSTLAERHLAWQLAIRADVGLYASGEHLVKAVLRLHNGTEEGERLMATGGTSNEALHNLRDALMEKYSEAS